jgi:hypothetical protein
MSSNAPWRQFSQAELDTQYNARATVSDIEAELKAYRELSLPMYEQLHCLRAMPYGSHPDETLDLFPVPGQPDAPLFVFIHGGYWRALTTQDSVFMAQQLVSQQLHLVTRCQPFAHRGPMRTSPCMVTPPSATTWRAGIAGCGGRQFSRRTLGCHAYDA